MINTFIKQHCFLTVDYGIFRFTNLICVTCLGIIKWILNRCLCRTFKYLMAVINKLLIIMCTLCDGNLLLHVVW